MEVENYYDMNQMIVNNRHSCRKSLLCPHPFRLKPG